MFKKVVVVLSLLCLATPAFANSASLRETFANHRDKHIQILMDLARESKDVSEADVANVESKLPGFADAFDAVVRLETQLAVANDLMQASLGGTPKLQETVEALKELKQLQNR